MSERDNVENPIVAYAKKLGVRSLKLNLQGNRSWPDRLFLFPRGQVRWMECKILGEEPEPLQKYVHRFLRRMGFTVAVIDNKEDGKSQIDAWIEELQ